MKSVKAEEVAKPSAYFNFNMNETQDKNIVQKDEMRTSQMFYQPQKQQKP